MYEICMLMHAIYVWDIYVNECTMPCYICMRYIYRWMPLNVCIRYIYYECMLMPAIYVWDIYIDGWHAMYVWDMLQNG